ncbi:MAG TPA: restriction endonuclease [Solirubrobacterales bacterium]|nr:restriction endonuclease [Solirubrobacterales bacterium]
MSRPRSALLPLPGASPPLSLTFDPALSQLRDLKPADLDALVSRWFLTLGLTHVRVRERRPGLTTYQAMLGPAPLSTPFQVRIYQRQNKLQVHHVDAFVGYLTRTGVPSGLLITTGGWSQPARLIAGGVASRRVGLLSGEEWTAALADARAGVTCRRLWRWIVDLAGTGKTPPRRSP